MKQLKFIVLGLTCLLFSCANDNTLLNEEEQIECSTDSDFVKTKDLAKNLIAGKWNWINTTYSGRGTGTTIITPQSTNKIMVYEFTKGKLKMYTDNVLTDELDYTVQFWGEGTNTVDEILVVKYGSGQSSMLFVNTSCLRLVHSFNDAGGDLSFRKI
jgi:hypothetical protein